MVYYFKRTAIRGNGSKVTTNLAGEFISRLHFLELLQHWNGQPAPQNGVYLYRESFTPNNSPVSDHTNNRPGWWRGRK